MIAFHKNKNKPDKVTRVHLLRLVLLCALGVGFFTFVGSRTVTAATFTVEVAPGGQSIFSPNSVSIEPGDTVMWVWKADGHSVKAGIPTDPTGLFDSGIRNSGSTFSFTFPDPGTFDYYCLPHGACCGMLAKVIVAVPTPSHPLNISTRLNVQTGDNVLIGGFIISGTAPKKVIVRGIGPSLSLAGVEGVLANPTLELHEPDGTVVINDNWKDTQEQEIIDSTIPPTNDFESAIVDTLDPGAYTVILAGKNGTTGVGLVEGYDLDQAADSQFANISTRGFVETESNVMIGGFILGGGSGTANVIIRALGPSLTQSGVSGALADPTLELHDENGAVVRSNDNWKDTQQTEIEATGIPPQNDLESALVATLNPGPYTAIVAGKGGPTGVGLVEVYQLP